MMEESRTNPANKEPRAASCTASKGLFNTTMGPLQRQLRAGEYNLFKCATMFESDFVQVSKRGGTLDVHNQVQLVRVAIAATSPGLQVPNVLLLARPTFLPEQHQRQARLRYPPPNTKFELTRLLPLCFVKISVHDLEKKQLRFKMATGRTFYLQLCPPLDGQPDNFDSWVRVVHLLRPPAELKQERKEQAEQAWLPRRSASPAMEEMPPPLSPEDGEYTLCEVLNNLQDEIEEDQENPAEPAESQYTVQEPSVSAALSPEGPIEPEGPPPLQAQSSQELPRSPKDSKKGRLKDRSSASRKRSPRSKSGKSRRSHSSKRAASQSPSKISSILTNSFSSTSQKHSKAKGRERNR